MKRVERSLRQTSGPAAVATSVVALAATAAAASSSNPKHFVGPTAVPRYGPNNYVVTVDGSQNITGYGSRDVTGSLDLWTVGDTFTTKQEWTNMDANRITDTTVRPEPSGGFVRGPNVTTSPVLSVHAPGYVTLSDNFYSFEDDYGADAVVANDGGATGSLPGGTLVLMQTAAGLNPDYRPVFSVGDVLAPATANTPGQINGGALTITRANGSALPAPAQTVLLDKNFQVSETPTNFGSLPYQELIWGVWLPGWTGDFKVGFELPVHTMFSSIRFDTAVGSMDGAPSLEGFALAPLYWDTNGTTAGAGGAAPSGNWNGAAANFNFDATGGAAGGATTAVTGGARGVVFTAGADGGGTYNVTLTGTQTARSVAVVRGNVNLIGGTLATGSFNVSAGATATVTSNVTGGTAGGVAKNGPGTLTLAGANFYAGGTTANDGVLVAGHHNALSGGPLTVNNTAVVRAQSGLANAVEFAALTVAAGAKLDLNSNSAALKNGGGAGSGTAGQAATRQATAYLKTGLKNGGDFDWLGPGISSTQANADNALAGSVLYGLGIVQNNLASANAADGTTTDETPGNPIFTTFKNEPVALNDTLIKFTYMGDADLSGGVDSTDYALVDTGFGANLSGWINGDFDYSGTIDSTDYALIDNAFGVQAGVLSEAFQARYARSVALLGDEYVEAIGLVRSGVVPEPAVAGAVALMSCGALVMRRRRRQS